jgi:hypothetical protein
VSWFRYVPFLGRLPECSNTELKEALVEVVVATIFSTMPVWFLPIISLFIFQTSVSGYESIRTGELFLLAAAMVGPLIYIISKNYGERREPGDSSSFLNYKFHFPYGQGFIYTCAGICLISSFTFMVLRNPLFKETELANIVNVGGTVVLSVITFSAATIVFFCAAAYRNSLENIPRIMPNQERAFAEDWENAK